VGQLLHNELIPELPFALKAKMAYQASKGMHFLHSSGTAVLLYSLPGLFPWRSQATNSDQASFTAI